MPEILQSIRSLKGTGRRLFLSAICALSLTSSPGAADWYTNNYGDDGRYVIGRFDSLSAGPAETVVAPSGTGFDAVHVAWASAVVRDDTVLLFASGNDGQRWGGVGLWQAQGGDSFRRVGRVLAPAGDESDIRMASVVWDARASRFRMWYGATLEGALPTEIRYAESRDGQSWTRRGTVLQAGEPFDRAGLVPDWVCRADDVWHLFYTAYDSTERSVAAWATSASPEGPFTKRGVVFSNDGRGTRLSQGAAAGSRLVWVQDSAPISPNGAYVVSGGDQSSVQQVSIRRVEGRGVEVRPALTRSIPAGGRLDSVARRKVSPSVLWRESGMWHGIFTGYGAVPQLTMEFTFWVTGPDPKSLSFDYENRSPPFRPLRTEDRFSTENPEPGRRNASCDGPAE